MNNHKQLQHIMQTIRQRRLALNYSQEYMAYKMQMGQNCYSKIELGNSKLTVERLLNICELLELDSREILQPRQTLQKVS